MSEEFVVRTAAVADASTIARHRAEMFAAMGELPPALYQQLYDQTLAYLTRAIPAGEYIAWLASHPSSPDVIAGAGVQLRRILPRPIRTDGAARIAPAVEAIVLNVFTEAPWRRRGVAKLLMEHVLAWARGANVDRLVLHASDEGRLLYERLGFVATNEMRYPRPLANRPS